MPFPYEHKCFAIVKRPDHLRYHCICPLHLDSLAHINENGVFYNGTSPSLMPFLKRHQKISIHNLKIWDFHARQQSCSTFLGSRGSPYLEPGTPIYVEDLEAWERWRS